MTNSKQKRETETDTIRRALEYIWVKHQYEDAISLTRHLLRAKPRYPLYYLMLSDCYRGIEDRDHDLIARDKSLKYYDKTVGLDGKFMRSPYFDEGIKHTTCYLLFTQILSASVKNEEKRLEKFVDKKLTAQDAYDAVKYLDYISEDITTRQTHIKDMLIKSKAGYNEVLIVHDSQGNSIPPTLQDFKKAKQNKPNNQIWLNTSRINVFSGKETHFAFNMLKRFLPEPPSESVMKARARRNRYYYNHQQERKDYQNKYDRQNRDKKRDRNKLDYYFKKSGLVKAQEFPREESDDSDLI